MCSISTQLALNKSDQLPTKRSAVVRHSDENEEVIVQASYISSIIPDLPLV